MSDELTTNSTTTTPETATITANIKEESSTENKEPITEEVSANSAILKEENSNISAEGGNKDGIKKVKYNHTLTIMRRELASYFTSPIAYMIIAINAILLSVTFFKGLFLGYNFFLYKSADMRIMFLFQAVLLTLFIPILTMRLYSDEKRTGSIETLMTLPITELNVAVGKTLAAFITSITVTAPCLIFPILISTCGGVDPNQILSGIIGLILLCAFFSSVGVYTSSITKHQTMSLFLSLPLCAIFMSIYVPFSIPKSIPPFIDATFKFLSTFEHFTSISHGVLDIRDVLYFVTLTSLFFSLTVISQKKAKD